MERVTVDKVYAVVEESYCKKKIAANHHGNFAINHR